jgi:cellulose synthase/poly-beta-1,6-N-acetylglucosamine synthase-like glycosyltransferase/cytoskeletal protein CcmA (bactofilin family)
MGNPFAPWADVLAEVVLGVSVLILGAGLIQNALFSLQLYCGFRELRKRRPRYGDDRLWWLMTSHATVPISLIVPAHNEEETIVDSIRSILSLHYPQFEVVVVNDGSRDGTLAALIEAFELFPVDRYYDNSVPHEPIRGLYGSHRHANLLLIDKEQGGKADALNAGINLSRSPVFCAVDADSVLESDALLRAVQPFVEDPANTVAVGGTIRITNGCEVRAGRILKIALPRQILPLLQIVEYLRAFLIGRLGWSNLDSLMLISGAFGIFARRVVVQVGGYSTDTVGEDMELVIKIHRHMREHGQPYAVRFVPDPVCWTECPSSVRVLGRQRMRWQRGALETFFKHAGMLFRPRYGRAGFVGMGHVFLIDVIGPPIEVLGYVVIPIAWTMGVVDWHFFAAYMALTAFFGVFISVGSLVLEEMELRRFPSAWNLLVLTLVAVAENFGYRQLANMWRIGGWWQFLRGVNYWNAEAPSADSEQRELCFAEHLERVLQQMALDWVPVQPGSNAVGSTQGRETRSEPIDLGPTLAVEHGSRVVTESCVREVLLVEGHLETTAQAQVLWVGPGGRFVGKAEVAFAEIHGRVEGELNASGKIAIHGAGRVSGTTRYRELVIEAGGEVSGELTCLSGMPSPPAGEPAPG